MYMYIYRDCNHRRKVSNAPISITWLKFSIKFMLVVATTPVWTATAAITMATFATEQSRERRRKRSLLFPTKVGGSYICVKVAERRKAVRGSMSLRARQRCVDPP